MSTEGNKSSILFEELVDNGFDFLERAIDEFDSKPKYSVVHFSIALELILKARLVYEHWALIVDGKPDLRSFKQGSFKSINYSEIISRIEGVLDIVIPKEVRDVFASIGDHRNRMVHFFHEIDRGKKNEKLTEKIAVEQSIAWYHLRQLLVGWDPIFSAHNDRIQRLNIKMQKHKRYLEIVYHQKKTEIENDIKKGKIYVSCPRCTFNASLLTLLSTDVFEGSCKVCAYQMNVVAVECSSCRTEIKLSSDNLPDFHCPKCNELIETEEIKDRFMSHNHDSFPLEINCAICSGLDTVVPVGDTHLCTRCFSISNDVSICGSCGDAQMGGGDLSDSFFTGCEFCDGMEI